MPAVIMRPGRRFPVELGSLPSGSSGGIGAPSSLMGDMFKNLASDGTDFGANTPQSLAEFIKKETAKYQNAVKVSGTKLE